MIKPKTLLFSLAPILLLITVLAIAPQLSIFSDGNFDKTLYTNKTLNASINIEKNVTIISAVFNVTEVDLGVANYEQIYNFYTVSARNGTDEAIAAGTKGYIAIINTTTGGIIYNVSNAISDYVIDSDFKEDGSEAILITASKNVLIYNASTKTATAYQPYGLSYLTGVSYSANDTYAIITSGASDPIAFYNATSKTFSNLSTNAGSTRCSHLSPVKDQAIVCTAGNIYWFNVSCALNSIGTDNFGSCSSSMSSFVGSTSGKVCDVAYKPDGTEALIVCMNGAVYRYNDTARTISSLSINTANDLKGVSYSTSGDKAIIVGESGKIFLYNTTTQVITALSSQYANNTNAVAFLNNSDAIIVGSGKSTLRYNPQYDGVNANISSVRTGESGILYHLSFKPNTAEALIVGDDGQVFKYNLSSKQITYLTAPASVPFHDVAYNWNGSEALIVGKAGTALKFNPSDNSFAQLNSSTNSSLTSVSYRNGTDTALIAGINNTLLVKNSSCTGASNSFCKLTLSGNQNEKTIVAFSPSGSVALIGQLCNQFIYNSTSENITGGSNWNSDGCIVTRGIAWKPDGTEALLVGRNAENDTCENAGYLTMIAVYNATANNFTGAPACRNRADILEDAAYSSDGSEALLIGRNGILIKYNTTNANYNNLNPSLTDLSSGTTGTLFGVDYRRDGIANEAILVVGDNKEILFYDGEKVMTSPEVFLGTARIWNFTGNYNGTTLINFTSNLTSYLSTCSADANGICSVPFYVNATTQTSIMRFHSINITYNHAPIVLSNIPSQSWNQDTSTTINLTQYFNDSDRDILTYGNTAVTSITISINQTTGIVTLTPSSGFYGTRYIIFNATDSINLTNSNNITLTINQVSSPPSGSSGGGGGGSSTCYPRWICTSWGYCINNTETRECIDANKCSSKTKPETTRNCTYEVVQETSSGGIPAGAVLIEEKKSSSSMLKPVSCTKQDKSRISIIREFNVYEVKRGDSIEYSSVISLTIENTGDDEATNIEIKEIIPEIMLEDQSLTFSVEGITLKGNTLRYNIQHLNAKEKAYLNYSVNAKIDGSAISQTPRAVTGFSIIDTRFNPFTFISGIPSFIFKVVWSLLSIAFFLSLALTAIHWIRYGNLDTKAWKLGIILLLPIIMSIFDFALANYLIVLAVMPIAAVELFVFVRKRGKRS